MSVLSISLAFARFSSPDANKDVFSSTIATPVRSLPSSTKMDSGFPGKDKEASART